MGKPKDKHHHFWIPYLIIIITAPIAYLLLSLLGGTFSIFGIVMSAVLGCFVYAIINMLRKDKEGK